MDSTVVARWRVAGVALDAALDSLNASEFVIHAEAVREAPQPTQLLTATRTTPVGSFLSAPFPNPTAGAATVALRLDAAEAVSVEVLDVLDRRVQSVHDGPLAGGVEHAFAVGERLPAGTYVVRVTGATVRQARRLVVAR